MALGAHFIPRTELSLGAGARARISFCQEQPGKDQMHPPTSLHQKRHQKGKETISPAQPRTDSNPPLLRLRVQTRPLPSSRHNPNPSGGVGTRLLTVTLLPGHFMPFACSHQCCFAAGREGWMLFVRCPPMSLERGVSPKGSVWDQILQQRDSGNNDRQIHVQGRPAPSCTTCLERASSVTRGRRETEGKRDVFFGQQLF